MTGVAHGDDALTGVRDSSAYETFVAAKANFVRFHGFDVAPDDLHRVLLPHQRMITRWALKGGRRAIFAAFGLGKSVMQLEIARQVILRDPAAAALIVCPLGVRQEFARDAEHLLGLTTRFVRRDVDVNGPGVYVTNYESVRDGKLAPAQFAMVSLDEAAVLRSYGSKTYQEFLPLFADVPYRFVATATPSPNRHKELIHYAAYLGIMPTGDALTRWFARDSTKANNLTLYPHREREFWLWLNTWATFVQRPSDLGFSDDGYDLPPLDVRFHEVAPDDVSREMFERDGRGALFSTQGVSISNLAKVKRDTLPARIARTVELVAEAPADHFVLWHDLEAERHALADALPDSTHAYGSQDLEERERSIAEFSDGRARLLATKPIVAGSGCNFQRHCHRAVFTGVTFKFHDFIQAVHRIQRFQQSEPVRVDVIHADTERDVVSTLRRKWAEHEELTERMADIVREHRLDTDAITAELQRSLGVERVEATGPDWVMACNDTVQEAAEIETGSVDLIVTSIPFSNHYSYSDCYEDFGSTDSNEHFWAQMDYLTPQLHRILAPGRIYACHVKDRILFGNVTGAGVPTVSPFHAEALQHGLKHGFDYLGMITVVTDVVRENNQTYRLGWSEMCKDATKMGVGSPEYVLLFHRPQTDRSRGYADTPVTHSKAQYSRARWQTDAHAFWRSSGERHLTPEEFAGLPIDQASLLFTEHSLEAVYDYEQHVRIGERMDADTHLPATFMALAPGSWAPDVWADVNRMRTLNTEQSQQRKALHVCPLQFDIVDRLIERFSNPGELVYDPFAGIGTVPLRAVRAGRRGRGVELNADYWRDACAYLRAHDHERALPTLFDLMDTEAAA